MRELVKDISKLVGDVPEAARALALLGDESALPALEKRMVRGDEECAEAYALILAKGDAKRLATLMEDPDVMIRIGAVRAARTSGAPELRPALRKAFESPDREVAHHAFLALLSIGDTSPEVLRAAREELTTWRRGEDDRDIYWLLNGCRKPSLFASLKTTHLEIRPSELLHLRPPELVATFENDLPMPLWIDVPVPHPCEYAVDEGSFETAEPLLNRLNAILEDDKILIKDPEHARQFWITWIDEQLK